jgi:hypothetical protein
MKNGLNDVRFIIECPRTDDCDGFIHSDMSCITRNNFSSSSPVDISNDIIALGRHDERSHDILFHAATFMAMFLWTLSGLQYVVQSSARQLASRCLVLLGFLDRQKTHFRVDDT